MSISLKNTAVVVRSLLTFRGDAVQNYRYVPAATTFKVFGSGSIRFNIPVFTVFLLQDGGVKQSSGKYGSMAV